MISLLDPTLALAAEVVEDIEKVRMANANRLRILTRSTEDVDGEVRGFGLTENDPAVVRLAVMVDTLQQVEADAVKNLQRAMRNHPLGAWAKSVKGVGDKQLARLLAKVGDPYWNGLKDQPRTVSQLWAYCGLHVLPADHAEVDAQIAHVGGAQAGDSGPKSNDAQQSAPGVAARRKRGQKSNWSTSAKTKAYLIAESCAKQLRCPKAEGAKWAVHAEDCGCSPYRIAYDLRRKHTATTHPDWTDGHSHNDGLRIASKTLLRDLWREAKRLHEVK